MERRKKMWKILSRKCAKLTRNHYAPQYMVTTMEMRVWIENQHTHKLENIFLDEFIELLTQGVR